MRTLPLLFDFNGMLAGAGVVQSTASGGCAREAASANAATHTNSDNSACLTILKPAVPPP